MIASQCVIKKKLCLNDINYFHVIEGLPSDKTHDVLAGLAVHIISDVFHVLVKDKCLKINIRIATFKLSNPDKANKPQTIKIKCGSNFKPKETPCEMRNLIRLLPLMLGEPITKEINCL